MDERDEPLPPSRGTALAALTANVERLLNDCDTLIAGGGHASAASLATLAFEECGRLYALRFHLAPTREGIDRPKFYHAVAMVGLSMAILRKYDVDSQRFYAAILPYVTGVANGDVSDEAAERLRTTVQAMLEPILRAQTPERGAELGSDVRGLIDIGRQVQAGAVGRVRARGFVLDIDAGRGVEAVAAPVPREVAERWAWAADGVLHLLRREDHRHPDSQEVAVLIEVLGQDQPEQRRAA